MKVLLLKDREGKNMQTIMGEKSFAQRTNDCISDKVYITKSNPQTVNQLNVSCRSASQE